MKDRVAIVTGAARGIGAATAELLAARGARVALSDVDATVLAQVAENIGAAGGECAVFPCDVAAVAQVEQLVQDVVTRFGRLDILVNNAAICPRIPVDEMTEATFDKLININLKSIFFLTRAAANAMKAQQWGRIVSISSTAGRIGAVHNAAVYSATKGGVLAMTKSLARHYAPYNILINAVAPGAVNTRMFQNITRDDLEDYLGTVPLRRLADPMEIAQSILPFCSEEMTWVTGATLDINGGVVMV